MQSWTNSTQKLPKRAWIGSPMNLRQLLVSARPNNGQKTPLKKPVWLKLNPNRRP